MFGLFQERGGRSLRRISVGITATLVNVGRKPAVSAASSAKTSCLVSCRHPVIWGGGRVLVAWVGGENTQCVGTNWGGLFGRRWVGTRYTLWWVGVAGGAWFVRVWGACSCLWFVSPVSFRSFVIMSPCA